MRKVLLLGLMLLFASAVAFAQSRVITGTVTSAEDGQGVPGVSILVKGTSIGTASDIDGSYSLSVPADRNVLTYSFIGLSPQEVTIGNRTVVNVVMESDVQSLSEFVVTSYGDMNKREVTGSIASVKGEVFRDLPMQSFDRAMQGRIAGVQVTSTTGQPGGALNVRIRGVGSVNAGTQPLYIIDGVQVASGGISGQGSQNALASINPNDIESIEVLKDAASASIYGAQAANGVVLITTRRGTRGATKVRLSVQEGVVQPLRLYDMMNSQELSTIKRQSYINAGRSTTGSDAAFGNPEDPNLIDTDWVDAVYRDGRLKVYDLSVSGGDEKTTFFLSGSHTFQEGQVIRSDYERSTGRMNLTHRPNSRLTLSTAISLSRQVTNGAIDRGNFINSPFMAAYASRPNFPIYNEDGSFFRYPSDHLFGYNIVQGVELEHRQGVTYQTVSNIQGNYQILPWLSFTAFGGIDFADNRDENYRPVTIPAFAATNGSAVFTDRRFINTNANANFNFNKKFGVHNVSGIAGYEYKTETRDQFGATGQNFPNPALRYLGNAAVPFAITGTFTEYKRAGFFGQAKYDYDDRYTADFTLRRDGHSRFGQQNRWGTFGAASVGWRLSSEQFMQDLIWLDNLRMRASYGITGNSEIENFASRTLVATGGQYLGQGGLRVSQLGNDLLTWEEAETFNVGLDWALFNGRLTGTVDFWRRNSNQLLFNTALPTDSGFGAIFRNTGRLRNEGIDFDFSTVNVVAGNFQWTTNFNISVFRNELIELYEGLDRIGNDLIVGKPISFHYGYEYAGVNPANGKPMYFDEAGEYTYLVGDSDLRYLGSALPRGFGGMSNNFSYGPFSLEVFFQYQYGNLAMNGDLYNFGMAGSYGDNQIRSQLNYWQNPGDVTNTPAPYDGGARPGASSYQTFSTRLLSDGSYVRLKQLTLNYQLPTNLLGKIGVNQASIFAQGLNLWTLTKFNGIDPEASSMGVPGANTTYSTYPNARQLTAGVNITF